MDIKKEKAHIRSVLTKNSYPIWLLNEEDGKKHIRNNNDEPRGLVILTYVPGLSDKLKCLLMHHNIRVVHKPARNIGSILNKHKEKSDVFQKAGVVYCIPCKDCHLKYIGETKRKFITRKKEHQRDIKNSKTEASALSKHAISTNHTIDWNNSEILCMECDFYKRRFIESFYINNLKHVMNDKTTVDYPNVYHNLN